MGNRSFILIMFVILFSCSFACVCHSGDLINEETNNMETKRVLEDKETKGINKYPRYFEIVKNDGTDLTVRIGEMVPDAKSYYYRLLKNGKKVVRFKNVKVDEPDYSVINAKITETGKYTFMIFINDAEYRFGAPWRIITNPIKKLINRIFRNPVWEQDVFVVKSDPNGLSKSRIDELAEKYAPFLFVDSEEHYFPASIDYLLNKEDTDESLNDLKLSLKFRHIAYGSKKKVVRRTRLTGVVRENISKILYKDLDKVLPYNGDNIGELDTIGINPFALFNGKNKREFLEKRKDNKDYVTVYYSFLPNPNLQKKEVIINYHFLYIYDSKTEIIGDLKKASHIFDRESISIVFEWDKSNPDVGPEPQSVIYGAHLPGQLITLKREDNGEEQQWRTRRVKVKWDDAHKIEISKNKEFHPIVAIAKGSHATYPVPGIYAVRPIDIIETKEPARTDKLLLPSTFLYDSKIDEIMRGNNNVISYKLKDLNLGSITSSSPNSLLAFSGYIVDIIGLTDAKFPPFTERETKIENWVNGTDDDPVHDWDPDKVDKTTQAKLEKLVKDIGGNLTKEVISKKAKEHSGGAKS
jgi:hypothetical protein